MSVAARLKFDVPSRRVSVVLLMEPVTVTFWPVRERVPWRLRLWVLKSELGW